MNKIISRFTDKLSKPLWQFFILLGFTLLIHLPILIVKQIENPDAGFIFPLLRTLNFPLGYLKALLNLETLDFQPVRDLTLYVDIFVFNYTGYTIGVLLNCIIWAGSCYQILRIIEDELAEKVDWKFFLFVLCFSVYPIFYNTVNWGIARKHLLAFFFILTATRNLAHFPSQKKSFLSVILPYTLSVLSLPIAVAWPFWAILHLGYKKVLESRQFRSLIIALMIITLLIAGINWAYYKTSITFLEIYPQKASHLDVLFMLVNVGFQYKQMIAPYNLSFFYNYDGAYLGMLFLFLLLLSVFLLRNKKHVWIWILFGFIPMAVTLSTPHVYYDPYVIIPLAGLFLFLATQFPVFIRKYSVYMFPLLIIWGALTWQGNYVWKDMVKFYEVSFAANPNCTNALMYGSRIYRSDKKMPNELFQYIQVNECFKPEPFQSPAMGQKKWDFEALMYFMEEEIDKDFRRQRLEVLGTKSFYAKLLYATFLAKEDEKEEVESIMADFNLLTETDLRIDYDPIIMKVLPDFCRTNDLHECEIFMKKWGSKVTAVPYF